MTIKVITWDWKEQPPMGAIGRAVEEISSEPPRNRPTYFREVPDTGGDLYAVVIGNEPFDPQQAYDLAGETS
jgi:hypothetical protein